jgi:hypothetical protein
MNPVTEDDTSLRPPATEDKPESQETPVPLLFLINKILLRSLCVCSRNIARQRFEKHFNEYTHNIRTIGRSVFCTVRVVSYSVVKGK